MSVDIEISNKSIVINEFNRCIKNIKLAIKSKDKSKIINAKSDLDKARKVLEIVKDKFAMNEIQAITLDHKLKDISDKYESLVN